MKLTDEQLSRILGENAAGQLVGGGAMNWNVHSWPDGPKGCILQVALNECNPDKTLGPLQEAFDNLFDDNTRAVSPERLLKFIEENK